METGVAEVCRLGENQEVDYEPSQPEEMTDQNHQCSSVSTR